MKNFLKPGLAKIIITIILLLASFFYIKTNNINIPDVLIEKYGFPLPYLKYTSSVFGGESYEWFFVNFLLNLIIWYLISCTIVLIWKKIKK